MQGVGNRHLDQALMSQSSRQLWLLGQTRVALSAVVVPVKVAQKWINNLAVTELLAKETGKREQGCSPCPREVAGFNSDLLSMYSSLIKGGIPPLGKSQRVLPPRFFTSRCCVVLFYPGHLCPHCHKRNQYSAKDRSVPVYVRICSCYLHSSIH